MSSLLEVPIADGKISAVYNVETYECGRVHHSFTVK